MSNVVQMIANQAINRLATISRQGITGQSIEADDMVARLPALLRGYMREGGTWSSLSDLCRGAPTPQTISKIASGDTRFPRFATVVTIYHSLGYRVVAVRS